MDIRKYSPNDEEAVIELWRACELTRSWNNPKKDISRKLSVQPELFLIGEKDGKVIASVMAGYDGHRGSVFYLAVAPGYQHRGYGEKLMEQVESLLEKLGCPKINIVVRSSNQKVLEFYENLGYAPDDVVSFGKRLIPDA